jgi:cytochrome c biogenesis protein CcdA
MKKLKKALSVFFLAMVLVDSVVFAQSQKEPLVVHVFHLPNCGACLKVIHDVIPPIALMYGDRVRWEYDDLSNQENYSRFLLVEEKAGRPLGTPTLVIGNKILVGLSEIADRLQKSIEEALATQGPSMALEGPGINILDRFKTFGPWAVIGAGLVDGINPCAFTVIVFFVSFLGFMGYRHRETALIGSVYILAVFLTYFGLGLGFFKALYSLKVFYILSKTIYLVIGGLSLFLGGMALRDYFLYKKTGNTDEMALQLPRRIKNKIHQIVGAYYRKDKKTAPKPLFGLLVSALVVGFMVSLLEAVCTGQLYLPTIVFVLQEKTLRLKALFYLIIYNLMFILPLVLILFFALAGMTSKQFEAYAKRHFGLIKIAMAAVFFALGVFLWMGAF